MVNHWCFRIYWSNLAHNLIDLDQNVIGIDNFKTGNSENIKSIYNKKFFFIKKILSI